MMKFENDNMILYCMPRAGTKSLSASVMGKPYNYYRGMIEFEESLEDPAYYYIKIEDIKDEDKLQVISLRNPLERFLSGNALWEVITNDPFWSEKMAETGKPIYTDYDLFMEYHGAPFLHRLNRDVDFKILPFDRIHEYADKKLGNDPVTDRVWKEEFNQQYKWSLEMQYYEELLENKQIITPEEFKCLS